MIAIIYFESGKIDRRRVNGVEEDGARIRIDDADRGAIYEDAREVAKIELIID